MAITQEHLDTFRLVNDSLGVDRIVNRLAELPSQIQAQQATVAGLRQAVRLAEADLLTAEAILTAAISDEVDPRTGKPAYSNDTARKAELAKRKSTDAAYQAAAAAYRETEQRLNDAQFELDRLLNDFSAQRTVGRLVEAQLRLLGN